MPIETFHISTHNKQQAGNKSICTEERGKSYDSYKCVKISVVNGPVQPQPKISLHWSDTGILAM